MKTQYRGILFRPQKGTWRAKIYYEGRSVWLGSCKDPKDAAHLYDAAARYLHRADAVLNFPEELPPLTARARVAAKLIQRGLLKAAKG